MGVCLSVRTFLFTTLVWFMIETNTTVKWMLNSLAFHGHAFIIILFVDKTFVKLTIP